MCGTKGGAERITGHTTTQRVRIDIGNRISHCQISAYNNKQHGILYFSAFLLYTP